MSNGNLYNGDEQLLFAGKKLPYSILQFWRLNLSELILNVTRGTFAEYIVQCALDSAGFPCIEQMKSGMEPWDLDGPMIKMFGVERSSRIEVKSCASIQLDTDDKDEPISKKPTQLTFDIEAKRDWKSEDTTPHHNNDLYVFCHYMATRKTDNILDLDFWEFYVLPTYRIREDKSLSRQRTISIWRLRQLGVNAHKFDSLASTIFDTIKTIEAYYTK